MTVKQVYFPARCLSKLSGITTCASSKL